MCDVKPVFYFRFGGFRYGYIGSCRRFMVKPDVRGRRVVLVENTIYNCVMCLGCRYFKEYDGELILYDSVS